MDLFDALDPFPIERGVAISSDRSARQRTKWDTSKFPFARMEPGDSFVVEAPIDEPLIYTQNAVSGAASSFTDKHHQLYPGVPKRVYTTRQQAGHKVRCWRVS